MALLPPVTASVINGSIRDLIQSPGKHLAIILALALVIHRLFLIVYRLFFHPLRHFPGPILARFTTAYQIYYDIVKDGEFARHCHHVLHPKYGPVIRVGPNRIRILGAEAFQQITKIGTRFTRDEDTYLMFGIESMMSDPSNEGHRQRRGLFQNAFRRNEILKAEPLVTGRMKRFMGKLESMCRNEPSGWKEINFLTAINCQGLEIFTEFAFGQDSQYLDTPDFNDQFAAGMHEILDATAWTKHFPIIFHTIRSSIPQWLRSICFPKSGIQNIMMAHSRRIIESYRADFYRNRAIPTPEKLSGSTKNGALLSTDIERSSNDEKPHFSPHTFLNNIFSEHPEDKPLPASFYRDAHVVFAASFGTIGFTLMAGLYHIHSNPEVYKEVLRELMTVVPPAPGKTGGDREFIDYATILERMPYFCAVVKENIRLSFTVAGAFPRVTPPEGQTLTIPNHPPIHLPGKSIVEVATYSAHMNPVPFPNPEKFDPSRWFDKQEAMRLDKHILAFGAGRTICLGMHMGLMQLHLGLANLIRNFEIELGDDFKEKGFKWADKWTAVERVETNMKFKVRKE